MNVNYMFRKQKRETGEELVDFSYEGRPIPRDLLSYKEMDIVMNRWAQTSVAWSSIFALLGMSLFCCLGSVALSLFFSAFAD